ncbi:MAG TPA: antitoxin [Spirochaetes bacterium]|nr:antitoxin [Spirochaetota bacterium]
MKSKLNNHEKDILDSFEKGEWIEVPEMKREMEKHERYARASLKKDKRINIRLSQRDLDSIQRKAITEGIPYQTLISSLIHKYVNGRLEEKKSNG